jgi:hypothetical protein
LVLNAGSNCLGQKTMPRDSSNPTLPKNQAFDQIPNKEVRTVALSGRNKRLPFIIPGETVV